MFDKLKKDWHIATNLERLKYVFVWVVFILSVVLAVYFVNHSIIAGNNIYMVYAVISLAIAFLIARVKTAPKAILLGKPTMPKASKEYQLLKQDRILKPSKIGIILGVILLAGAFACLHYSDIHKPTDYYTTSNNSSIVSFKYGSESGYYLNGEKLFLNKQMADEKGLLSVSDILGLASIALLFGAVLMLRAVIPNIYYYCSLIQKKFMKKQNITDISISSAPAGIMALREWDISGDYKLKSTAKESVWESCKVKSDAIPKNGNLSGIYAYRLGTYSKNEWNIYDKAFGIVCLTGHCVGHKDNIIRASNCTILMLITKKEKNANELRKTYGCPVLTSSNPIKSINKWAMTRQGLFWMQHNNEIIEQGIGSFIDKEIAEMPEYQKF